MLDALILARIQFASTTIFHYFFVPMSIGLALVIAIMQTLYVVKNDDMYKRMTKFWGRLFLINFAVGVVTGILQEFQFGMNWSTYSRFVGDVFGPSLAIEALAAFFMESTFIGLWIFGWDRLSKRVHLLSIWLVAIGTALSAFWILTANSFMQHPVGYELVGEGARAQMNSFAEIVTNPYVWVQFPHVITSAFATGAFFVAGMSMWKIARKQEVKMFKASFKVSIIVATIGSLGFLLTGHNSAAKLVEYQPMKLAAAEALWETSDPAAFSLIASIDTDAKENNFEVGVPGMLSLLAFNKFSGEVEGLNDLQAHYEEKYGPGDYIPPVKTVFWTFRGMAGAGTLLALLGLFGIYASRKDLLESKSWYAKIMPYTVGLALFANSCGWIVAEMGRQPWVVFGVMQTADAVSPMISPGEILFSLIAFTAMYSILAGILIFLFKRVITREETGKLEEKKTSTDPFDKEDSYVIS